MQNRHTRKIAFMPVEAGQGQIEGNDKRWRI